jgi:hypothetical protein
MRTSRNKQLVSAHPHRSIDRCFLRPTLTNLDAKRAAVEVCAEARRITRLQKGRAVGMNACPLSKGSAEGAWPLSDDGCRRKKWHKEMPDLKFRGHVHTCERTAIG